MTFDDGIVGIYELTQIKVPSKMPVEGLSLSERYFFGYDTLGINRYYTALQAKQEIVAVINIPGWHEIAANRHIAIIAGVDGNITADEQQYRIVMVQPMTDEYGLRITKMSLERIGDSYAVFPTSSSDSSPDGDG